MRIRAVIRLRAGSVCRSALELCRWGKSLTVVTGERLWATGVRFYEFAIEWNWKKRSVWTLVASAVEVSSAQQEESSKGLEYHGERSRSQLLLAAEAARTKQTAKSQSPAPEPI